MYLSSRFLDEKLIFNRYRNILLEQDFSMSPEMFRKFKEKISYAKFTLYKEKVFLGLTLSGLRTIPTEDIPTMAVDDAGNIYINPNFVLNELSVKETIGVLAHEAMHIATLSFYRQKGRDHNLWNVATDYIMNRDLLAMNLELPKLGLLPVKSGNKWLVSMQGVPMKPIDITDLTAEQLYAILKQEQDKMKELLEQMIQQQQQLDKHLSPQESDQIQPQQVPGSLPGDEKYNPESFTKGKLTEGQIKGLVDHNLEVAKKSGRGTESGIPQSLDIKFLKPATNWKTVLREFVRRSDDTRRNWTKPRKKALAAGYYAPRVERTKEKVQLVVGIDTSGSIDTEVINVFATELLNIIRSFSEVTLHVLMWDTNVYKHVELDSKKQNLEALKGEIKKLPYSGGGTTISCIKQFLDKNMPDLEFDGLLVFTDGFVENTPVFPNIPSKNMVFMITQEGTDDILKKYGKTFFVDIPHS